jgi:hypothetical protein
MYLAKGREDAGDNQQFTGRAVRNRHRFYW